MELKYHLLDVFTDVPFGGNQLAMFPGASGLDTGAMQIVVSEQRSEPFDLGCFTHCGIDPTRKRYVLIKSRQHFRAGFEPIARHIVMCDGDGCCASDLSSSVGPFRASSLYFKRYSRSRRSNGMKTPSVSFFGLRAM